MLIFGTPEENHIMRSLIKAKMSEFVRLDNVGTMEKFTVAGNPIEFICFNVSGEEEQLKLIAEMFTRKSAETESKDVVGAGTIQDGKPPLNLHGSCYFSERMCGEKADCNGCHFAARAKGCEYCAGFSNPDIIDDGHMRMYISDGKLRITFFDDDGFLWEYHDLKLHRCPRCGKPLEGKKDG